MTTMQSQCNQKRNDNTVITYDIILIAVQTLVLLLNCVLYEFHNVQNEREKSCMYLFTCTKVVEMYTSVDFIES